MKFKKHTIVLSMAVAILASSIISIAPALAGTIITLEQPVHFLNAEGSDIILEAGQYELASADAWLRVTPSDGQAVDALLLEAVTAPHEEAVTEPSALSVQGEQADRHHLVLLLPDGKQLEAVGTYSGIRPRGGLRTLSPARRTLALNQASSSTSPKVSSSTPTINQGQLSIQPGPRLGGGINVPQPPLQTTGKPVPNPPILVSPTENFEITGSASPQKYFTWHPPTSGPGISSYRFKMEEADNPSGYVLGPTPVPATSGTTIATSQIISYQYRGKRIRWSVQACTSDGQCSAPASRILVWSTGLRPPQLRFPESGATVTTLQPRLEWSEVREATYYLVCVSKPGVQCPSRETAPGSNPHSVVIKRIGPSNTVAAPDLTQFFGEQMNWTVSACTTDGNCAIQPQVRPITIAQAPTLRNGGITLRPSRAFEWVSNSNAPQFKLCVFTQGTACAASGNLLEQDVSRNNGKLQTDIPILNQLRSMAGKGVRWQVAACTPRKCLWSTPATVYIPESVWRVIFSVRYIDLFHDCDEASPGDLKFSFRASISPENGYYERTSVSNFDFGNYNNFESGTQIYVGRPFATLPEAITGDEISVWGVAYDCDRASCGEEVVELLTTGSDDKLGDIPRRNWKSHRTDSASPLGWLESDNLLEIQSRNTSCYALIQGLRGTEQGRFDHTFSVFYEVQKTKIW